MQLYDDIYNIILDQLCETDLATCRFISRKFKQYVDKLKPSSKWNIYDMMYYDYNSLYENCVISLIGEYNMKADLDNISYCIGLGASRNIRKFVETNEYEFFGACKVGNIEYYEELRLIYKRKHDFTMQDVNNCGSLEMLKHLFENSKRFKVCDLQSFFQLSHIDKRFNIRFQGDFKEFFDYAISNGVRVVNIINSVAGLYTDDVQLFKQYLNQQALPNTKVFDIAIKANNTNIVDYLIKNYNINFCRSVIITNIDKYEFFKSRGFHINSLNSIINAYSLDIIDKLTKDDILEISKYSINDILNSRMGFNKIVRLVKCGYKLPQNMYAYLDCNTKYKINKEQIEFYHNNGVNWCLDACCYIIHTNNTDIIEYAIDKGCQIPEDIFEYSRFHQIRVSVTVINYLISKGAKLTERSLYVGIENKSNEFVEICVSQIKVSMEEILMAFRDNNEEMLKILVEAYRKQ